jgi:hypothetical protein
VVATRRCWILDLPNLKLSSVRVTGYPEVETYGRGGATMILPGETEAGSAGTQPCRGIAWWLIETINSSAGTCSLRCFQILIGSVDPDA